MDLVLPSCEFPAAHPPTQTLDSLLTHSNQTTKGCWEMQNCTPGGPRRNAVDKVGGWFPSSSCNSSKLTNSVLKHKVREEATTYPVILGEGLPPLTASAPFREALGLLPTVIHQGFLQHHLLPREPEMRSHTWSSLGFLVHPHSPLSWPLANPEPPLG